MKFSVSALVGAMAVGLAFTGAPAQAVLSFGPSGVCPTTIGHAPFGGGGTGTATDCNLFITFAADGSISTSPGPENTFDGVEDALIGVYNNTGASIPGFHLSGSGIGGFDGDGINGYANGGPIPNNANDTTTYGGQQAYFTNNTGNALDVNFIGGIPAGGTAYFSLEEPASLSLEVTAAPEPASMALLGAGLAGLGIVRRRRRNRK